MFRRKRGNSMIKINRSKDEIVQKKYHKEGSGWSVALKNISAMADGQIEKFGKVHEIGTMVSLGTEKDEGLEYLLYKDVVEEQYVVDVINGVLEDKEVAFLDSWESNLNVLKESYTELQKNADVDMNVIDQYIADYESELRIKSVSEEQTLEQEETNSIDAEKVKAYIKQYWNKHNSSYPNWENYQGGADCANFASQCMHAGGKGMIGSPGTTASVENVSNWFSRGNQCVVKEVSESWRSAQVFKEHWLSKVSHRSFKNNPMDANSYAKVGDAVSLLNANGVGKHTMVIYAKKYIGSDMTLILAAHTSNTDSATFISKCNVFGGGAIIFNM